MNLTVEMDMAAIISNTIDVPVKTRRLSAGATRAFMSASFAILAIFIAGCEDDIQAPELRMTNIRIGEHVAVVELAVTPEQRRRGLMHRRALLPNHGMLFVFEREEHLSFWMKDTPLPLSIAFIDAQGRIFQIEDMEPFSEEVHTSRARALYALEMERGWFRERVIEPGAAVEFPPDMHQIIRYYRGR